MKINYQIAFRLKYLRFLHRWRSSLAFLMQRVISVHCVAEVIPTDALLAGFLVSLICNKREKGAAMEKPCSETEGEWITIFLWIKVFIGELRGISLQIHLTADFSTVIQRNIHCQLFLLWSHPSSEKIIVFLKSIVLFTVVERGRDGKKDIESLLWLNWILHVIVQLSWSISLHVFLLFSLD